MQIHDLKLNKKRKTKKRVGRGGKRGTYSGRGIKGQKARAGRRIRPQLRDILKKVPKRRGYGKGRASSLGKQKQIKIINIKDLDKGFGKGDLVSPAVLVAKKLVRRINGKIPEIKILGGGSISKALKIENCLLSESAAASIKKAGGSVVSKK